MNEIKVDEDIRSVEITKNVSKIASYKKVREFLVEQQRLIAKSNSCILDGRDIGSVVFPNADYKFFMTATPETRARRRFLQGQDTNVKQTEEEILKDKRNFKTNKRQRFIKWRKKNNRSKNW